MMRNFINIVENARTPVLYHATPAKNLPDIQKNGLRAVSSSRPGRNAVIYLTHQQSLAVGYAERGFGVDGVVSWVIFAVDPAALDESKLHPDWDSQEAELNFDNIVARGYTPEQVRAGEYPWQVGMEEIGQIMYAGNIPASALRIVDGPRRF